MKLLHDYRGLAIRFTDERLAHVLEHREMQGMEAAIVETLQEPQQVVQSYSDPHAYLYYRYYFRTLVGRKYLCTVVKIAGDDAFVLTAYLTDRIKRGTTIWPKNENT
jgi:hypothetical protein